MNDLNTHPLEERTALLKQAEFAMLTTDAACMLRREILDRVAPWYLFPGTQARPRVVGLWGMPGTGRTHFDDAVRFRHLRREPPLHIEGADGAYQRVRSLALGGGEELVEEIGYGMEDGHSGNNTVCAVRT